MSKGCKAYALELSAYFDDELEGDAHQRIEQHLAECSACRDTLRRLGRLREALHTLARPKSGQRSILQDLQERLGEAEEDAPAAPDEPPVC